MSLEITPAEVDIVPPHECKPLAEWKLYVMAAACGTSAANIYYNSPLLDEFSRYFHVTESQAGLIATAAQVGYGVGLLFFVPLGDLLERRKIVLALTYACMALLVATARAPNLTILIVLQGLVGIAAMSAQLLIPLAVDLTPAEKRGHTVGLLLAGLLCGLLMVRVAAGFIGDYLGWCAMFGIAAGIMLTTGIVLQFSLPHRRPSQAMSYGRLMQSLLHLVRDQPVLRRSSIISGLSFGAFMIFWTALSFLMREHFHRGATESGLFGIVGLAVRWRHRSRGNCPTAAGRHSPSPSR
ncbi:MAG: MFS transporter [Tepidisphaeraceae bacterium]